MSMRINVSVENSKHRYFLHIYNPLMLHKGTLYRSRVYELRNGLFTLNLNSVKSGVQVVESGSGITRL